MNNMTQSIIIRVDHRKTILARDFHNAGYCYIAKSVRSGAIFWEYPGKSRRVSRYIIIGSHDRHARSLTNFLHSNHNYSYIHTRA